MDQFDIYVDESLVRIADLREFEPMATNSIQNVILLCNNLEYFLNKERTPLHFQDKKEVWSVRYLFKNSCTTAYMPI